jgi:hypothetical protein
MSQFDYGSSELKSDSKTYLRRWRLEPKDPEAYARGELVEPIKPIVYYLDPATPEKLRKYIKMGIEEWQKPLKGLDLKMRLLPKMHQLKKKTLILVQKTFDIRLFVTSLAQLECSGGPSVTDPRTGEIIESDVIWYHNHLRSYRNRYLLETGLQILQHEPYTPVMRKWEK